jgi:hypothetical protein
LVIVCICAGKLAPDNAIVPEFVVELENITLNIFVEFVASVKTKFQFVVSCNGVFVVPEKNIHTLFPVVYANLDV